MTTYVGTAPKDQPQIVLTNKNYIINPTFSVNQRVFAGGSVTNGDYLFDRWNCRLNGAVSLPDASGFVTLSTFTTNGGLRQKVEDFGYVGNVTVSWEGTSLLQYYDANSQVWSTPAASPVTFNMVAAGASETDVAEQLLFGNGTLKNAKLEIDSVATPFEYPDTGTELTKCQRYYEKIEVYQFNGYASAGSNIGTEAYFKATKRDIPVVVQTNGGSTNASATTNQLQVSTGGYMYYRTVTALGEASFFESATADAEL